MRTETSGQDSEQNQANAFPRTALIYAYKTKNAERWGVNPNETSLAYQVYQPLAPHQCDWGINMTAHMLKAFKSEGGVVKVINKEEELIMPLSEHKVMVPVPQELLKEWGLASLLD